MSNLTKRAKLEIEVEAILTNYAYGSENGISSRLTADKIVQLVQDTLTGLREPEDAKPWAPFAVNLDHLPTGDDEPFDDLIEEDDEWKGLIDDDEEDS